MIQSILLLISFAALQTQLSAPSQTTKSASTETTKWVSLFNGKSLDGWKRTEFAGAGTVEVEPKFHKEGPAIVVKPGESLSGFNWVGDAKSKPFPKTDYEFSLEFMKIEGYDFACGLTFPVGESHASLILGGWGGAVMGISSINEQDASNNETTKYLQFLKNKWYKVRLRVTAAKIEAWLDDKRVIDTNIVGKTISLRRGEISMSIPLGISNFQTTSAFRLIKLRTMPTVPTKAGK